MKRYHTKTGSTYEVDGKHKRIRKLKGGVGTTRVTEDWRSYEEIDDEVGVLRIYWGQGRDETSDRLGTPKEDVPSRWTVTSPIVRLEED